MARVWRWQDEEGRGPYGGFTVYDGQWDPVQCPVPAEDFAHLRSPGGDSTWSGASRVQVAPYRFGFPAREAERAWFTDQDREVMARHGMRLVELEAAEVIVSDSGKQCMFRPETAREVVS